MVARPQWASMLMTLTPQPVSFRGWRQPMLNRVSTRGFPSSVAALKRSAVRRNWACRLGWLSATVSSSAAGGAFARPNHPAIAYATSPQTDPVFKLNQRLKERRGDAQSDPVTGYLRSVLKALNVPVESQVLVFSKTSFQAGGSRRRTRAPFISVTTWRSGSCVAATCSSSFRRTARSGRSSTR